MSSGTTIPEIQISPPPRDPAWGYREIAVVICAFIGSMMFFVLIGLLVARYVPAFQGMPQNEIGTSPLFFVPIQLFAYLGTYAITYMMVTTKSQKNFWEAIHWELPDFEMAVFLALSGVVLALVIQFAGAHLPMPSKLPIQQYFREPTFAYMMVAFGLLAAPFAEELFFRGLLYPVLFRSAGNVAAVIVTSAGFSLLHQSQLAGAWAPLLLLFTVGLVLTITRVRLKSVAASWIVHFSYNATLFGFLFYSTNGFRNMTH